MYSLRFFPRQSKKALALSGEDFLTGEVGIVMANIKDSTRN
jgi:hypothetical protein